MEGNQSNQPLDRLLSFLASIGYNFTNDKGMMEHCRDGRNMLKVVAEVIKHFEPNFLRRILAIQSHHICQDIDRHRESLPVTTDFLVLRQVFRATGFEFKLVHYFHAERQVKEKEKEQKDLDGARIQAILSHLYVVWQWNKQIQGVHNTTLGKIKLLEKDTRNTAEKLAEVTAELAEVQRVKVMERPAFIEKTKSITEVREELARIRARKAEMATQKGIKEKERINKIKQFQECIYRIQGLELDIVSAKKELSINAPEVRKEKLRQDAALQSAYARQQRLNEYIFRLRELVNNKFSTLETNLSRITNLTPLEVLESRSQNLKIFSKKLTQEEEQNKQAIKKLEEEINNQEKEINNQDKKEQLEVAHIAELKTNKSRLVDSLQGKKEESKKLAEGVSSLITILTNVRNDIEQREGVESDAAQATLQDIRKMEREVHEWKRKVATSLQATHQPFNLGLFQESDSPHRM